MEFKHTQRYLKTTPRKLREVVYLIKEMSPKRALEVLPNIKKKAAGTIFKVVNTSVANAKQKGIDLGSLSFKEIQVQEGPVMKRFRAGARGRAKPYKKRMSHLRIILETEKKVTKKSVKPKKVETKKVEGGIKKELLKRLKRRGGSVRQKKADALIKTTGMRKVPAKGGNK